MGTAGPLALARDILDDGSGNPFFVLNRCLARIEWFHLLCILPILRLHMYWLTGTAKHAPPEPYT